jgi:2-methylisocitrate lyase-like PEP mutase family enzyme
MIRIQPPRTRSQLAEQARALAALHRAGQPLVLPNAWDAGSARAVVAAGFPVVATTSAGVARSLGFEDHQAAPVEEMLAAAARIASAVSVPVTVDFEAGYGLAPDAMIERLLEAGAAGCNVEDSDHAAGGLVAPAAQAERIAALRAASMSTGVPFVLNARVDVFVHEFPSEEARLDEGIRRAILYRDAGADCVYPILMREPDAIARFVHAVRCPVNVLALGGASSLPALVATGVHRISFGSLLHTTAMRDLGVALDALRSPPQR